MKKILLISISLILISTKPAQAKSLEVSFGNPPVTSPNPIFTVENMLPGDIEQREIKVKNISSSSIPVVLYSLKKLEEIPNWEGTTSGNEFSQVLELEITENSSIIYSKTLKEFFEDSKDGLNLGNLDPTQEKTFNIKASFSTTAGNEYQRAKVVFDLMLEQFNQSTIVINEVYYDPDNEHGDDGDSNDVNAIISGNGAGSVNIIDIHINNTCVVVQKNNANINNNISISANTGNNSVTNIITGNINIVVGIINNINVNIGSCDKVEGNNDEWVELYNAGNERVNLKNWKLTDDSGEQIIITNNNLNVDPGEFVLLSKSSRTWRHWEEDKDALKVSLGKWFGDGLGNDGDHLVLINRDEIETDAVGWENDNFIWTNNQPEAQEGNSIERITPGFDSNNPEDWLERIPPTPGS